LFFSSSVVDNATIIRLYKDIVTLNSEKVGKMAEK
jgi:hypothetical protein